MMQVMQLCMVELSASLLVTSLHKNLCKGYRKGYR